MSAAARSTPPKPKVVLIAGPTASGKSALALSLAERLGGAVINADSMQVYSELRVITARPDAADFARAAHILYGHVPAREAYSAARFVADAAQAIADATSRGLLPILVGGTGLYFKALLEGLSPIPPIDPAIRDRWRRQADVSDAATLHAELARRDAAAAARLRSADTQRVVRALEVIDSTGRSLADWQQEQGAPTVDPATAAKLVVDADRATLCRRADARVHAMLGAGALDEARALADLALDPALPAMRAIGVAPLVAAARGELALAAAAEAMAVETRQYIKRQQTWLKRHMIAWHALQEQETESRTAEAIAFIES